MRYIHIQNERTSYSITIVVQFAETNENCNDFQVKPPVFDVQCECKHIKRYNNPATWSKIHTANATDTHSSCRLWNRAREWAPSTEHIRTNKHTLTQTKTHKPTEQVTEWASECWMVRWVYVCLRAIERASVRIEKRMENQFSDAWKGGCVWPHLYFDAIGRALVAKASKGPRWKLYTHTVHTYSSSALILARASNTDFNDFYDVQLVFSFVCTHSLCICVLLLLLFFYFFSSLKLLLSTAFCSVVPISCIFFFIWPFSLLLACVVHGLYFFVVYIIW